MFCSQLATVVICLVAVHLFCFTSTGESKSILNDSDSPPPPVPENRLTSRRLEILMKTNGTQMDCTTQEEDNTVGLFNGIIGTSRNRWTNFYIYPDPSYNSQDRTLINNAAYRLSQAVPCVRFGIFPVGSRPSGDYVHIIKGNGCYSKIGKIGGRQELSLGKGCVNIGTIMHEMIHALGFFHEQSRPDRDNYVNINWQNIRRGQEHNFERRTTNQVTTYGVPYNLRSIMHYGSTSFTSNGRATITARNGAAIGSTGNLQQSDIDKLRRMYRC